MKRIEFLYPELCNIFAESYNVEYLARCNSEIEVVNTRLGEIPHFMNEKVDMVYLGGVSEAAQEKIAAELLQYKGKLEEMINDGIVFLVTGNAIELFGEYVEVDASKNDIFYVKPGETGKRENRRIEMLGLFKFHAVRDMVNRHNSQFIGHTRVENGEDLLVIGHKSQFTFSYYGDEKADAEKYGKENCFINIEAGVGMNPDTMSEGIRKNNFFATYSLGPFLILNPLFCKYLLRLLGLKDELCFEAAAVKAYEFRVGELREFLQGGK